MSDPVALLRMAADYRRRAEAPKSPEERARYLALAEYCDQVAGGMERRPGMIARLGQAIVRAARRGCIAARTYWHRCLLPARGSSATFTLRLVAIVAVGCIGVGIVPRLWTTSGRGVAQTSFSYPRGAAGIPESAAPVLTGRSFSITALLEIPQGGATGMIITRGGLSGGWAFYLENGKPVFHSNQAGVERYTIAAERPLAPGQHKLVFAFNYDGSASGGGTGTILANGEPIAQGRIEQAGTGPTSLDDQGLDIGEDTGTPVNRDYDVPFKFTGKFTKVTIGLTAPPRPFGD
jgi:hypothetical protein